MNVQSPSSHPRILVCDDLSEVGLDVLRQEGFEVLRRAGLSADELLALVPEVDALLVRSRTRVTDELLAASSRLRLVGRAGYTLDTIDIEAATRSGVVVMHSSLGNEISAAEFAIGLLFSLARRIPQADASMRAGRWDKRRHRGVELTGKTLGVIGMGAVGRNVVQRALALQMHVVVHDPGVPASDVAALGARSVTWDEVLRTSDFISLHVSASERTRGLIGDAAFEQMKDRVRIVNCSRGSVIDEGALVRAIRSGKVAGAALDIWDEEPPVGNPLISMAEVVATPHLVAATFEAQINVAVTLAEQVRDFFLHGSCEGVVNPEVLDAAAEPGAPASALVAAEAGNG